MISVVAIYDKGVTMISVWLFLGFWVCMASSEWQRQWQGWLWGIQACHYWWNEWIQESIRSKGNFVKYLSNRLIYLIGWFITLKL